VVTRILVVVLAAAALQEAPADELGAVLKRLRELRSTAYAKQRARAAETEAARAPLPRLEAELAELATREAELDRQLAELGREVEGLKTGESALRKTEEAQKGLLDAAAEEGRQAAGSGPPFRLDERRARADGAKESVARYWSFLQEELRLARSGEAYSAEVPLSGGRRKPARCFRVGHLFGGFVTEDGLEAGRWDGTAWVAPSTPEEERAIRDAVETLDRHRAPALLRLAPGGLK
jgi:septal ring factor EnvC (AmiA/AmiB activator)